MKIIVILVPINQVINWLFTLFVFSYQPKTRINFSGRWFVEIFEKYLCFLFRASRTLRQSHAEFNSLIYKNFLTCCSCSITVSCLKKDVHGLKFQ